MPELPEVQTIVNDLQKELLNLRIDQVIIRDKRVLKQPSTFCKNIIHKTVTAVKRRGKAIIIHLKEGGFLFVQVKMTGQLIYNPTAIVSETKIIFHLSNAQTLHYNDQRTFGWLDFSETLENIPYLKTIGPEPLSRTFTLQWLKDHLKGRKAPIKSLLMNQHFIAGIGNIYASEILFQAGIDPQKPAQRLQIAEIKSLHQATRNILKEAIRLRGTSMRNYRDAAGEKGKFINRIKIYGREHQACPICNESIVRIVQSGRSTFLCPKCQESHETTHKN